MSKVTNSCGTTQRATKMTVIVSAGIIFAMLVSFLAFGQKHNKDTSTIRMAAILFRHGEKNPTSFYPTDIHARRVWPGGPGALTMKGSLQAYTLGSHLRELYSSLLPDSGIYSQSEMHVLSSYAERCIMSAQALLAGLLPVLERTASLLPVPWQPVSVTSVPRLEDALIAQKKPCAKYDAIMKNIYTNPPPDLKQLDIESAELYRNLTEFTGKPISTVLDVEFLYNTLKAEEDVGLTLPPWTKGIYPDLLLPLAERSYTVFTDNELMKRVKGGAFLKEVQQKMTEKASETLKPDRKLFLYSGHDVTLVNVMNSMGILDQTSSLPDYASALVFELHKHPAFAELHEVRIVYFRDSQAEDPIAVSIPNCPSPCALESFTDSIRHLLFDDYDEICENLKEC